VYIAYNFGITAPATNEDGFSIGYELNHRKVFAQNNTEYNKGFSGNFTVYENATYGIVVEYPENWTVLTPTNVEGERTTFIVSFISPDGTAQLDVNRDIFDRNETIDTYLAETIQSYAGNSTDFTLISSDTISAILAGNPGYELLYSETDDSTGAMLLTKEIGTILGDTNMVYFVSYYADIAKYANYEFDADGIIDSLEIHIQNANATSTDEPLELELEDTVDVGEI
jgi:hypothetical protein